jgi:4-amino-4-deoxy-L-arabinose transferase-like glycosyltransferase
LPAAYVKVFFLGTYFNATGRGHCPVYLLGKLSQRGWWYYFPIALALKTPLALFALLVIAAFLARTYIKKNPLDELGLMAATILILVFFTFFCTAQIGVRYLLPIFPLLYVFAGKVASHRPHRWAGRYRAGILGLVLWFVVSSVSFHPHYIPYFNELIGDRKNMYRYLADSNVDWGQTAYYLQDYLERHRGENISVVPAAPISGKVIVSVNSLVGVSTSPERYEWLRDKFAPVDHIGYGLLIYDIPEAELPVQPTE